jgi:GNAT superfamily N-acetyltransferase
MGEMGPRFYVHEQSAALQCFLPLLHTHLPHANPLYNRLQAPHNIPSRHCLYAATFPSTSPGSIPSVPEIYTVLFADRSRHEESQIWIFNTIITHPAPLAQTQRDALSSHLTSAIFFLKGISIPEAPGWPFSPFLRFACVHEAISQSLEEITRPREAMPYITRWNAWNISTSVFSSSARESRRLPDGFRVGRVPEDQLDIVIATSSIKRQPSTYLILPSVGLLNENGLLVAWGYVGIDGSFATLYVLPDYRGKGLASYVAEELLRRLGGGDFKDMGYDGKSGWVHSDVKAGNEGSEKVMKSLGGKVSWGTSYIWVDSDKF